MARLAFVFPGQGSQSVGMGIALAAIWPEAAATFAEADAALGESLTTLIADGPAESLDRTENAQPALLATSTAFLRALEARAVASGAVLRPAYAAGHSMGQYSALVAAGSVTLADGIRLVRERGRLMQQSGEGRPGAMAAFLGLDDSLLPEVLELASQHGLVQIANRNAPGQVVISGERPAVEAAAELARGRRARKVVVLPVSVAAHSPLMAEAATGMASVVAGVAFADPMPPLLANRDGRVLRSAESARRELVEHLTSGVDWVAVVNAMVADGVDTFVEVGPGRVLTGLVKRVAPDARALALDDAGSPDGLSAAAVDAAIEASASTSPSAPASSAAPVGSSPSRSS